MSLSSTAAQQRDRQTRLSHPVVACGVISSIFFHAGILPVILLLSRKETPPEPAQIEIVVIEPAEPILEEPETVVVEEETVDDVRVPSPSIREPLLTPTQSIDSETLVLPNDVIETIEDEVGPEVAVNQPNQQLDNLFDRIRQQQRQRGSTQQNSTSSSGTPSGNSTGDDQVATGPSSPNPEPARSRPRTVACRRCPKPSYPRRALDAGAEGTVNIMVDINSNGDVTSASLVGSSGYSSLDQAALSTVRRRWRFQPIRGGASGVVISVVMTIDGSNLNRRAREQGDNTSVEVPSQDTGVGDANENDPSTASTPSDNGFAETTTTPSGTPADTLTDPPPTLAPLPSDPASPSSPSTDSQPAPPAASPVSPPPQPEPTVEPLDSGESPTSGPAPLSEASEPVDSQPAAPAASPVSPSPQPEPMVEPPGGGESPTPAPEPPSNAPAASVEEPSVE